LLLIGLRPAGQTESANQYDDDYCEYERREQVPDFHEIEARLWMNALTPPVPQRCRYFTAVPERASLAAYSTGSVSDLSLAK